MATDSFAQSEKQLIDPSKPFRDVVVCCTSIPPEQRTDIDNKVQALGGVHKYDLTPNVTHLIVGDYDTPKYRHVARERPDIEPMHAMWIEAVSELWKNDEEIDFGAMEAQYRLKALERCGAEADYPSEEAPQKNPLLICLTGFGRQRDDIAEMIKSHGAQYTGDLTKKCTHLIVKEPEGKKFLAAKDWGVKTVTLDWLTMSIERGMILEETKFDPLLPQEEQGKGAWTRKETRQASLGKRTRSFASNASDEGPRKLRKSASMKLSSQRNGLWGDILGRSMSKEYSFAEEHKPAEQTISVQQPESPAVPEDRGVLSNCVFCAHGFNQVRTDVLESSVVSLGAAMVATVDEAARYPASREPFHRFLIVPQESQPDTHPRIDHESLHIVTEFYIESCLHNKRFVDPNEHVLGRPFPLFPIPGFDELSIGKAAFTGIELSQVARAITQLGAKRDDDLRKSTSVLVCKSLQEMRKEKLHWALTWGVPVVSEDWLWECISTGYKVPFENFIYPEIKNRYKSVDLAQRARKSTTPYEPAAGSNKPKHAEPGSSPRASRAPQDAQAGNTDLDDKAKGQNVTAAVSTSKPGTKVLLNESVSMADFSTAQTHLVDTTTDERAYASAKIDESSKPPAQIAKLQGLQRTRSEPSALVPMMGMEGPERVPSAPPVDDGIQTSRTGGTFRTDFEKKQAKAAEREQLSSRITSLIHSGAGSAGSADSEGPAPRPRNRRVLGRAVSNASNASSVASIEASKPAPETFRVGEIADSQDESSEPPPATQLGYNYPEAQEYKAALLSGINGRVAEAKKEPAAASSTPVHGGTGRSLRRR